MPTIKRIKHKSEYRNSNVKKTERQAIYNTKRWHDLRRQKLMQDPLCEDCLRLEDGRVEPATEIHHNISFMSTNDPIEREQLAYDFDNLVSLCSYHHKLRHGTVKKRDDE